MVGVKRRQRASRVAMQLSPERFLISEGRHGNSHGRQHHAEHKWRVLYGTAGAKSQSCLTLWLISQLGRAYCFLETSTLHRLEDGDGRMSNRQSDSFIVPRNLGNASGGKVAI